MIVKYHLLFLAGLFILILGRFDGLLREVNEKGNFPTRASEALKYGAVFATVILWAADLLVTILSMR